MALFLGLPFGFYMNGILLRHWTGKRLYWFGVVFQGISTVLIVFLPVINNNTVAIYGIIGGIGMGLFWSNLTSLILKSTTKEDRIYFSSLQSSVGTIINFIVPLVTGYLIVLGEMLHLYSSQLAYRVLSILALIFLFFAGYIIQSVPDEHNPPTRIILLHSAKRWQLVRLFRISEGLVGGTIFFIPSLMVLLLVGKENTLGLLQSATAILSAIAVYILGKRAQSMHRVGILVTAVLIYLLGSLFFSITYSAIGVFIYLIAQTIFQPLQWTAFSSLSMDVIEDEQQELNHHPYQYVFDQEFFLNLGRIIGIVIYLYFFLTNSTSSALRYTPLILGILQLSQVYLAKKLS